jgi:hypothetical protein
MIPYAFKLLNQEVHSLGISMDNKTGNAMTKWQATRNWELLVDPNLFCLSESKQTKIKQSSSCIGVIYHQ